MMNKVVVLPSVVVLFILTFGIHPSIFSQALPDNIRSHTIAHNLGSIINSTNDNFGAYLADDTTLFFVASTSSPDPGHNIFVSKRKQKDSTWQQPIRVKIGTGSYNAGGLSFDTNGNIYYASDYNTVVKGDVDIW